MYNIKTQLKTQICDTSMLGHLLQVRRKKYDCYVAEY